MKIESLKKRVYEISMGKEQYDAYSEEILEHIDSIPNVSEYSESYDSGIMRISWTVVEEDWTDFKDLGEAV